MARKILQGLFNLSRMEIHPLTLNVFVGILGNRFFLSDGNRFVEYNSFEACLETRVTRRKLHFGEDL
jgi:hypothetical protein